MTDYHACVWPTPLVNGEESLAQRFDSLNEPGLSNLDSILEMEEDDTGERPPLITFSHFLPLQVTRAFRIACSPSPCAQGFESCNKPPKTKP